MPEPEQYDVEEMAAEQGRFNARPDAILSGEPYTAGLQSLEMGNGRDGVLYVPPGLAAGQPAPLVLVLHGATGNGERAVNALLPFADHKRLVLMAPDSLGRTWDVLMGGYGPDVARIDRALQQVFRRVRVDSSHIAIEGFSDGASYGLSLGIANGDLFTHVLAFSPGFCWPPGQTGAPKMFVSHGRMDQVLPIDMCSRMLVPALRGAGYDVRYEEFDGPHTVPREIAKLAVEWFLTEP